MVDAAKAVGKIVQLLYENLQNFRLENDALRMMLLNRGLTKQAIRRGVREYRKDHQIRESASQILTRACQEILKNLAALDSEELLAKLPIQGKPN